jgi:hypothetical protein
MWNKASPNPDIPINNASATQGEIGRAAVFEARDTGVFQAYNAHPNVVTKVPSRLDQFLHLGFAGEV